MTQSAEELRFLSWAVAPFQGDAWKPAHIQQLKAWDEEERLKKNGERLLEKFTVLQELDLSRAKGDYPDESWTDETLTVVTGAVAGLFDRLHKEWLGAIKWNNRIEAPPREFLDARDLLNAALLSDDDWIAGSLASTALKDAIEKAQERGGEEDEERESEPE